MAPVPGTIDATGAKTGLPPSLSRANFGDVSRLRSRALVCETPRAKDASREMLDRSANLLLMPRDPRHARGAPKSGLKTVMLRRSLPNTWLDPLHVEGTVDGFAMKSFQLGLGTVGPTHTICVWPLLSPFAS